MLMGPMPGGGLDFLWLPQSSWDLAVRLGGTDRRRRPFRVLELTTDLSSETRKEDVKAPEEV